MEKGNGRHNGSVVHHSLQLLLPLGKASLELDDGVDPVPEVGHPGHHPGLVPLGAADAPRDNPDLCARARQADEQGSAAVALKHRSGYLHIKSQSHSGLYRASRCKFDW